MEPTEYSLFLWFMACTANHNYHWLLRYTTFLQRNGGGHECTRPTPIRVSGKGGYGWMRIRSISEHGKFQNTL